VKDTNPNAHIRVFKNAITANGETVEADIINLFGFTLRNNTLKWGENFVQNHLNYTFDELEQTFNKRFRIVKNDGKFYIHLKNFQQQVSEWVEIYYERLLKLANCLQMKVTDVFLTIIFRINSQPHLKLAIVSMIKDTLIKHKEAVVICEESG
jgi:hypothetical protein